MTAPDSSSPASTEPSESRPRLVINGVPVRPEDLGRSLSESVLRRLDVIAARERSRAGTSEPRPVRPRTPWAMGTVFLLVGLGLVLWLLWK